MLPARGDSLAMSIANAFHDQVIYRLQQGSPNRTSRFWRIEANFAEVAWIVWVGGRLTRPSRRPARRRRIALSADPATAERPKFAFPRTSCGTVPVYCYIARRPYVNRLHTEPARRRSRAVPGAHDRWYRHSAVVPGLAQPAAKPAAGRLSPVPRNPDFGWIDGLRALRFPG